MVPVSHRWHHDLVEVAEYLFEVLAVCGSTGRKGVDQVARLSRREHGIFAHIFQVM